MFRRTSFWGASLVTPVHVDNSGKGGPSVDEEVSDVLNDLCPESQLLRSFEIGEGRRKAVGVGLSFTNRINDPIVDPWGQELEPVESKVLNEPEVSTDNEGESPRGEQKSPAETHCNDWKRRNKEQIIR